MDHNHEHCQHENLKYCEHCKVVHCLDCKQEFPEKVTVTVEKIVYKERGWTYPQVTWDSAKEKDETSYIIAVSDKTAWDKDRFIDGCNHS